MDEIYKLKKSWVSQAKVNESEYNKMYNDFFEVWRSVYHNVINDMDKHHELLKKYNFS